MSDARLLAVRRQLQEVQQQHLLAFYDSLTPEKQEKLLKSIEKIDWSQLPGAISSALSQRPVSLAPSSFRPIPAAAYGGRSYTQPQEVQRLRQLGLAAVADGKVGVVLLAGGQATRLGVKYPKGMYDVGLPSGKSLYQLHAEKALRLQQLAGGPGRVVWYVMTSEATQAATVEFFERRDYFGLRPDCVNFFKQFTVPCVGLDGKLLLADRHLLQTCPDGNGGLYRALRERGILADMEARGLQYLHVFGVDNILTRVADPDFVGFCIDKGVGMAAKIVEKSSPEEKVGVVTLDGDGRYRVVEYSEISADDASRPDPSFADKLLLRAGNICQHFLTFESLRRVCAPELEARLPYHPARKKIPHVDADTGDLKEPSRENGVKLEKFVFDVFPLAGDSFAVWEVPRREEFSPLKNSPSASSDCPATCRRDLLSLHADWLRAAGHGHVTEAEVSPLLSYAGEGLGDVDLGQQQQLGTVRVLQ